MFENSVVYCKQPTQNWVLANKDEHTYIKELIYEGTFEKDKEQFSVDSNLLDHWATTHKQLSEAGVEIPVPIQHTDDPEARRGSVVDMYTGVNSNGLRALFGKIKFRDEESAHLAKTAQVSIMSPSEFVDGKGNRYTRPIRHVALTDYPVVPGLQGFEAIAASFVSDDGDSMKEDIMPLLELAKRLNIECDDEAKLEDTIVASFEAQTTTLTEKDAEITALKAKIPSDPLTVTASHRTLLKDNRKMKLDKLVSDAVLSPAAKADLELAFCNDESLNLVLSQENGDDKFDTILAAIAKNKPVELGETDGIASLSFEDIQNPEKNPLVADAKRRAKAAERN